MKSTYAVAVLGTLFVVIAWLVLLSLGRTSGVETNSVAIESMVWNIQPGRKFCQKDEVIPGRARAIEFFADFEGMPSPEINISVKSSGKSAMKAHIPQAVLRDGLVRVPLVGNTSTKRPTRAHVCIHNRGTGQMRVAGQPGKSKTSRVGTYKHQESIHLRWYVENPTWKAIATALERSTYGTVSFGRWSTVVLLAVVWLFTLLTTAYGRRLCGWRSS